MLNLNVISGMGVCSMSDSALNKGLGQFKTSCAKDDYMPVTNEPTKQ